MQIHGLVAFTIGAMLHEARVAALYLNAATGLLLDVLHIGTAMPDHLSSQIETRDRFEIDRDSFFWPFATSKLITFDLLRLSASKSSFIHKIG